MQPGQQRLTGFVQPQPPADAEDVAPEASCSGARTPLSCRPSRVIILHRLFSPALSMPFNGFMSIFSSTVVAVWCVDRAVRAHRRSSPHHQRRQPHRRRRTTPTRRGRATWSGSRCRRRTPSTQPARRAASGGGPASHAARSASPAARVRFCKADGASCAPFMLSRHRYVHGEAVRRAGYQPGAVSTVASSILGHP